MSEYESVAVPFVKIGNRRALTDEQLANDPYLEDLVRAFPQSFERADNLCIWLFVERHDTGDGAVD